MEATPLEPFGWNWSIQTPFSTKAFLGTIFSVSNLFPLSFSHERWVSIKTRVSYRCPTAWTIISLHKLRKVEFCQRPEPFFSTKRLTRHRRIKHEYNTVLDLQKCKIKCLEDISALESELTTTPHLRPDLFAGDVKSCRCWAEGRAGITETWQYDIG